MLRLASATCAFVVVFPAFAAPPAAPKPAAAASAPSAPPAPVPLADSLSADAKADYASARLLYGDGDYQGALVKFKSAYDKSNDPRLLWNIAACEKNLRHYANVLRLIRRYQTEGAAVLSQSDKDEANELIRTIEPLTAQLTITVDVAGAEVFVDDERVGETPLAKPTTVDIGMRKVRIHRDGYVDIAKDLPVGGSPSLRLDVKLVKIVHEGRLAVTAGASDTIAVDGKVVGVGTWSGVLASGGHMLRVTAPDMRPYQSDVLISDNDNRSLAITLDKDVKPGGGVPAWVWIGGGVLVAGGIAVGSYALFRPSDKPATLPEGTLQPGNVQAAFPNYRFR